jgi:hypothetical protein
LTTSRKIASVVVLGAAVLALTAVTLAPAKAPTYDRPLNADLIGDFTFVSCPAGAPPGGLCLHDRVSGEISDLGSSTGEFDVMIDALAVGADGCSPISKLGSFVVANGDRLDVSASGRYCFATSTATYDFTLTGGTGSLAGTRGSGTWLVPQPSSLSATGGEGAEYLRGTITYPRRPHSPDRFGV